MLITEDEREVIQRLARGMSQREIGRELYISPSAVYVRLHRLRQRLGFRSTYQLMAWYGASYGAASYAPPMVLMR